METRYCSNIAITYFEKGAKYADRTMIEKACKWLKDNWRKHVWLDGDNIIHFGLWENDFRKAMEE